MKSDDIRRDRAELFHGIIRNLGFVQKGPGRIARRNGPDSRPNQAESSEGIRIRNTPGGSWRSKFEVSSSGRSAKGVVASCDFIRRGASPPNLSGLCLWQWNPEPFCVGVESVDRGRERSPRCPSVSVTVAVVVGGGMVP